MPDPIPRQIAGEYFFVNNCFGSFYRGVLDWMAEDFYTRFQYKVIGTYDKAIEFFNKKKELGHEVDSPLLPSVTLDPMYDFSPEERGGRFLWQTRHLAPGIGAKIFQPIDLKEQDVIVTPVFSRYQGTFEMIFWLDSVYELLDFRTLLLQFTGGYNRWIRPKMFWSYIILPDEIKKFKNEEGIPLDWGNTDATFIHIDNINKQKFAHPILLNPMMKLDSFNDSSTKYGNDQIAEYKLSASFTYEIELPTYMVLTNKIGFSIEMNFTMGNAHTKYGTFEPRELLRSVARVDHDYHDEIRRMSCYRVTPEAKDNAVLLATLPDSVTFPSPKDIIHWNPIFKGKLVKVTNSNYQDVEFEKGDVLYCDEFDINFIRHFRRSSGMICKFGGIESTGYKKATILTNSLLTDIRNTFLDLDMYIGQDITVDIREQQIFLGLLDTEQIPEDDDQFGYHELKYLRDNEEDLIEAAKEKTKEKKDLQEIVLSADYDKVIKQVVIGKADGVATQFTLPYKTPYPDRTRIYIDEDIQKNGIDFTISGTLVTFTVAPPDGASIFVRDLVFIIEDLSLAAIYEFTEADLENKSDEFIEIDLPFTVPEARNLVLVTYSGVLSYYDEWELDLDTMKLTIKEQPRLGELVEIFRIQE